MLAASSRKANFCASAAHSHLVRVGARVRVRVRVRVGGRVRVKGEW